MGFDVLLSDDAAGDIEDIYRYIAERDSVANAERVLLALEETCLNLADMPERGNVPKELVAIGMTEFREVHVKPYRVLYRIASQQVIIYCVVDGRRDMQNFLQRRLLR